MWPSRKALLSVLLLAAPLGAQAPDFWDVETPAVLLDSQGRTVAVWVGTTQSGEHGIFVRREDAPADSLRLDAVASSSVSAPSLAPLANGGFAVAWNADDGSGAGLFLRLFDAAGRPASPETLVSAPRGGDQEGILHPLPGGGFAAVWTTPGVKGREVRLALRRFTATGVQRGPVVILKTFGTAETFNAVTPGPGNAVLVSWRLQNGTPCHWRAQRISLEGAPLGPSFAICTFTGEEGYTSSPSIAAGGGGYIAVWDGPASGIFGRRFALTGAPLGPTFRIDTLESLGDLYDLYGSTAVATPAGAFAVVWVVEGETDYLFGDAIQARLYGPDGTPLAAPSYLDSPFYCLPGDGLPSVAAGLDNRVAVAWESLCWDPDAEAPAHLDVESRIIALSGPPPGPGSISFSSLAQFGANEEDGFATVEVRRTGGSAGAIRLLFETAPGTALPEEDYVPVSGRLIWTYGNASPKTVRIPIVVDDRPEGPESFRILLRHFPGGGPPLATATVSIDSPGFLGFPTNSWDAFTEAWEGDSVTLQVERTGGRRGAVSLGYGWEMCCGGEPPIAGRLAWPDGDATPKHFTIRIPDDFVADGYRVGWAAFLSEPTGGARISASVHYVGAQDDEVSPRPGVFFLSARQQPVVVGEAGGFAELRVLRVSGMGGTVSVRWSVQAGTATPGADFQPVSGILTWGDSDVSLRPLRIPILNDSTPEGDETFDVLLSLPRGGARLGDPASLRVTIRDDD